MALSDEQIVQLSLEWPAETNDWASHIDFARAIEAEVRKQDEALIRQMLDALELPGTKNHQMLLQCAAAERAARARLGSKP